MTSIVLLLSKPDGSLPRTLPGIDLPPVMAKVVRMQNTRPTVSSS